MTKDRLETFSDSVMAIVITLLAFELKSPVQDSLNNIQTYHALVKLLPEFLIFALSFITISIMWINHHYITHKIEEVTHRTVWTNSILLLFICLIPFATSFLGDNPKNQVALVLYSALMLCASFAFSLFNRYSAPANAKRNAKENFRHIGVYAYTFAIFVAIFMPIMAYFVLLVPPLSYILPGKD